MDAILKIISQTKNKNKAIKLIVDEILLRQNNDDLPMEGQISMATFKKILASLETPVLINIYNQLSPLIEAPKINKTIPNFTDLQKIICSEDNRFEPSILAKYEKFSESLAIIVDNSRKDQINSKLISYPMCTLKEKILERNGFGESCKVSKEIKFQEQKILKDCLGTAFIVSSKLLLTTKHILQDNEGNIIKKPCDVDIVFGHNLHSQSMECFFHSEIYKCKSFQFIGEEDLVLLETDRVIKGREPLRLMPNFESLKIFKSHFTLGYPEGLPIKVSMHGNQIILGNVNTFFCSDLDLFTYNSGSPIFDINTNEVIGIAQKLSISLSDVIQIKNGEFVINYMKTGQEKKVECISVPYYHHLISKFLTYDSSSSI